MLHYKLDPKYIKSAIKPNNSHAAAQCYQNFHKIKKQKEKYYQLHWISDSARRT